MIEKTYYTTRSLKNINPLQDINVLEELLSDGSKAYSVTNGTINNDFAVKELREDSFLIDCYDFECAYELAESLSRCACQ